jgi:hypothetical protein
MTTDKLKVTDIELANNLQKRRQHVSFNERERGISPEERLLLPLVQVYLYRAPVQQLLASIGQNLR